MLRICGFFSRIWRTVNYFVVTSNNVRLLQCTTMHDVSSLEGVSSVFYQIVRRVSWNSVLEKFIKSCTTASQFLRDNPLLHNNTSEKLSWILLWTITSSVCFNVLINLLDAVLLLLRNYYFPLSMFPIECPNTIFLQWTDFIIETIFLQTQKLFCVMKLVSIKVAKCAKP